MSSTDIKDYYRRAWGLKDRPGFKYGGSWGDWMVNFSDQMTFEEYLQDDNITKKPHFLDRKAEGGRIGFADGPPGTSSNQYGPFKTKSKIGRPTGNTISKSEFNKIKKLLKDRPGIGIYPTQREGAYTIKVKVEKSGEILRGGPDLLYSKDNLDIKLKEWQSARDQLFPNQITDAKFKELRLLNSDLTDGQFADFLNENKYLTSKGNAFTETSAFNWKKRLNLGSLGPREFRTIDEAKKVLKEKFGNDWSKLFKTDKEIFAKATQIINDVGKYKGSFPRGPGAEGFLWHSFDRAAKAGSKQITYDLSALGHELPMEDGKLNWNKKINGVPAWKLVKFKDNAANKTFSYGDLKNQVNTAYNNTNKFNDAVKGYYEQAGISQKFKDAVRDKFLIKELETKLGRKITKADDDLVKKWLTNRRPGFSLTQVHHPEGVTKNVYNTQNVFSAANLKERDLIKTYNKEVKTLGETQAKENYKKNLQAVSDEFGGIQTKFEGDKKYIGSKPTEKSITDYINKVLNNAGVKLSKDQKVKAQSFLRNALNKGQNIFKFVPNKVVRKGGGAALAVLDYSLFHHLFGVPQTEALIAAGGWLTKNDVLGKQIVATSGTVGMMEQDNPTNIGELVGLPGPYKEDDTFMVDRMKGGEESMNWAVDIKEKMKVPEKKEVEATGVDKYLNITNQ